MSTLKTENGMNRQPPEERAKDLGRYAKARMKKTIKGRIGIKTRIILSTILILILIFILLFFSFTTFDLQKQHAKGMAQTIYDELEVESLTDFIEIKGDDKEIKKLSKQLGFKNKDMITVTYWDIYDKIKHEDSNHIQFDKSHIFKIATY